jgi:hypothetical protein
MSSQDIMPAKANNTHSLVLLKDKNLALVPGEGPEINSWAYLWVLLRLRHQPQFWLTNQRLTQPDSPWISKSADSLSASDDYNTES